MEHPQFQNDGHKKSHGRDNRGIPVRHCRSFEIPRQLAMEFMGCRPGVRNSDTSENRTSLSSMAYGMFPFQKLWGPSHAGQAHNFDVDMERLAYTREDVVSIVEEYQAFQTLKASLRQRGCVTNTYLKENFHHYARHVKDVRERRSKRNLVVRQRSLRRHVPSSAAA